MRRYSMSPKGKPFTLTDEMISLRDNLAVGLGFVKRPCSLRTAMGNPDPGECWERPGLTWEHKGKMMSPYHCVPKSRPDLNGDVWHHWPEDAETAAWAIDKGKPKVNDAMKGE